MAELLDARGDVISTTTAAVTHPARPAHVSAALTTAARAGGAGCSRRPRLAVVSAADPVDRATGRLVHLPDSPFLVGELAPADVLADLVDGPVMVDNDVNWAARAERDAPPTGRHSTTSPTSTSARAWAAPSSTTAGAPRTRRPGRRDRPRPHDRSRRPGRPPHRRLRRARSSPGCVDGDRRARAAGRGRTRRCASTRSAGRPGPGDLRRPRGHGRPLRPRTRRHRRHWGTGPSSSTPLPMSSSDSPAMSRSGRAAHPRTLPRRRQEPLTPPASRRHRQLSPIACDAEGWPWGQAAIVRYPAWRRRAGEACRRRTPRVRRPSAGVSRVHK